MIVGTRRRGSDLPKQYNQCSLHNESQGLYCNFCDPCTNYLQSYWFSSHSSRNLLHGASRPHQFGPVCTSQGHLTLWFPGSRWRSRILFSNPTWGFKHTSFPLIWILSEEAHIFYSTQRAVGQPSLDLPFKSLSIPCSHLVHPCRDRESVFRAAFRMLLYHSTRPAPVRL